MLVTLGLLTLGYCLIVRPGIAILEGMIEGHISASRKLGPRRVKLAREIQKLEDKIAYQNRMAQQYLHNQNTTCQKRPEKARPLQGIFANNTQNKPYRNPAKGRIQQRKK